MVNETAETRRNLVIPLPKMPQFNIRQNLKALLTLFIAFVSATPKRFLTTIGVVVSLIGISAIVVYWNSEIALTIGVLVFIICAYGMATELERGTLTERAKWLITGGLWSAALSLSSLCFKSAQFLDFKAGAKEAIEMVAEANKAPQNQNKRASKANGGKKQLPNNDPTEGVREIPPTAPNTKAAFVAKSSDNGIRPAAANELNDNYVKTYIDRFSKVAVAEMDKFGIPASISMAQAIIESRSGTSKLAIQNNNHFGIKCFSKTCSQGHCTNHFDDNHKDFFVKYAGPWESWRAHSQFLMKHSYRKLLSQGKNYKAWARGLRELGYATDGAYDKKIIAIIERYSLYKLDNL